MVPDSELSAPTLMFGPEVSTHDAAFVESDSVALFRSRTATGWSRRRRFPQQRPLSMSAAHIG